MSLRLFKFSLYLEVNKINHTFYGYADILAWYSGVGSTNRTFA
jgi:hypothetical protein